MTDQEASKLLDELKKEFGSIPNPVHHPAQFTFYVKFLKYLQKFS